MESEVRYYPEMGRVAEAMEKLKPLVRRTPLEYSHNLSEKYGAEVWLKREDMQVVRSYKLRGAYNKISSLDKDTLSRGIVCASAGNHAQGVAWSCRRLECYGWIYMPVTTPRQKIRQVEMFGGGYTEIVLTGDTFDDANAAAEEEAKRKGLEFIHPFDDPGIIEGQATVGLEILGDMEGDIDLLFIPVGGGGLASGVGAVFKEMSPSTELVGVEPAGAPSMKASLENGRNTAIGDIDRFVDGAAVKRVGDYTFSVCQNVLDDMVVLPEGLICSTILSLYNQDAIIAEPAGAMSVAALELNRHKIRGKKVVCIISGSNNDITRTDEIRERALLYEGIKHYFIVRFPQRAGALREFVNKVLGPKDDITRFEYYKKNSREKGPALIGIELGQPDDLPDLQKRMKENNFPGEYINNQPDFFNFII